MRRFARGIVAPFVLTLVPAVTAPAVQADENAYIAPSDDPAAWLYDSSTVVRIDLAIPEASRTALAADPYEYVSAAFTLVDGATTYGPWAVKLKLKGRVGSFRDLSGKSAFKLKFGNAAERVSGLKKLTLNNMVQDPSSIHETLAYDLFRGMGIPAPRTGYAVVTVDGVDFGLHLNVETLDDVSLAKWYGAGATQHLYEGSYGSYGPAFDPLDPFSGHYEVDEGDADDRSDLDALIAASQTDGDGWRAAVEEVADLQELARMWAVERYIAHWDGYSGRVINNYCLHSTTSNVFTMLPWGVDQTFSPGVENAQFSNPNGGILFTRCMSDAACRGSYADALAAVRDKAAELGLAEKAETLFASLADEIDADTRKEYDLGDAIAAKNETVRFLADRPAALAAWFDAVPAAPGTPTVVSGDERATFAWTASVAAGPSIVNGYRIQYRRGREDWATQDLLDPAATGFELTGLVNGGRYKFRIGSLPSRGAPAFGRTLTAVVGGPPAVTMLAAHREATPSRIEITWRPAEPDDDPSLRFEVQYRRSGATAWRTHRRRTAGQLADDGTRRVYLLRVSARHEYEVRLRPVNRWAAGPWTAATSVGP